jgi:hypothetical protein
VLLDAAPHCSTFILTLTQVHALVSVAEKSQGASSADIQHWLLRSCNALNQAVYLRAAPLVDALLQHMQHFTPVQRLCFSRSAHSTHGEPHESRPNLSYCLSTALKSHAPAPHSPPSTAQRQQCACVSAGFVADDWCVLHWACTATRNPPADDHTAQKQVHV